MKLRHTVWGNLCLFGVCLSVMNSSLADDFAWDADLGGVPSPYTAAIVSILRAPAALKASQTSDSLKDRGALQLTCLTTLGNDVYIGVKQAMAIDASFSQVAQVLDDIDHYKELFRDFKDIHRVSHDRNKLLVYWEQSIPLFFVPNAKYEMIYLIDSKTPDRRVYRYQLAKKSDLKTSDGFVQISKTDETHTSYVEYDFFDAEWGAMAILGKTKIWHAALEGIAFSDLAIRLKAENPSWTYERIRRETEHQLDNKMMDQCIEDSRPFKSGGQK